MKSDTPDELFVFPDHLVVVNEKVSKLTQEDIDDMSVDPSFPLRNPRYGSIIDDISDHDVPFQIVACYKPLQAWRDPSNPRGKLLFSYHTIGGSPQHAERTCLRLPCGQCCGCRLEYSRQWAVRCCHESSLHIFNCFITRTYSPEHLPADGSQTH